MLLSPRHCSPATPCSACQVILMRNAEKREQEKREQQGRHSNRGKRTTRL